MRCNVDESESVTLSRFRARLREEIQRELFMRDVQDLELAYQVARNAKRFSRGPLYHKPEAPRASMPNQPSGPKSNAPSAHRDDRDKAPF